MKTRILRSNKGKKFSGPLIIEKKIFQDKRGVFFESWNKKEYDFLNINKKFVQDNISISEKGVLRGLHFQAVPKDQDKLVFCLNGEIYDVLVDIRKDSDTYCEWGGVNLSSLNNLQLWIPSGFAHGFIAKTSNTIVQYKTTDFWDKDLERSIAWNDPELSIDWPIEKIGFKDPIISEKDFRAPKLKEIIKSGHFFR